MYTALFVRRSSWDTLLAMVDLPLWLTHFGTALITAIVTIGVAWLMLPVKRRAFQAAKDVEVEGVKSVRAMTGADEDEQLTRMAKLTELFLTHREHGVTPEALTRYKHQVISSKATPTDPVNAKTLQSEHGPNGYPVGFLPNGDKVEWVPNDEDPTAEAWPMILLRNENDLHRAEQEMFERVWWVRHQVSKEQHPEQWKETPEDIRTKAEAKAAEIESKYGRDSLVLDDFEWGMVNGKLSALRWVIGSEWDMLDT